MKRNNSRIRAMMVLYNYNLTDTLEISKINDLIYHGSDDIQIDIEYSDELIEGVVNNLSYLDTIIASNLENWTIERLSFVDRNIIRLALYEMIFKKIPANIVINEFLDISREYSQVKNFDSVKFNNALLDKIAQNMGLLDEPRK